MEEKAFFTAKEREQLFALYKRLLQLSGDTLQKGDCHKLKNTPHKKQLPKVTCHEIVSE